MENYFDILLKTPLFAGIDREELASLLNCLQASQQKKGLRYF